MKQAMLLTSWSACSCR